MGLVPTNYEEKLYRSWTPLAVEALLLLHLMVSDVISSRDGRAETVNTVGDHF
jgi:hypothetical protein